jgi:hypothetical protein
MQRNLYMTIIWMRMIILNFLALQKFHNPVAITIDVATINPISSGLRPEVRTFLGMP